MSEPEVFPWVEDITAPAAAQAGHIDNIQITGIMYNAWMNYLVKGVGLSLQIFETEGRPTVREITARFDAEVFPGDALQCGVRALGRRRRSFTLRQVLWNAHRFTVATGTVVLVTIDPQTWRPVEIPSSLWAEIERAEGKSLPVDTG